MLLNLIAIDPGGETGVAWAMFKPGQQPAHLSVCAAIKGKAGLGKVFQIGGNPKDQVIKLKEFIDDCVKKSGQGRQQTYKVRTVVVCESFTAPSKHVRDSVLLAHTVYCMLEFYLWLEYADDELEWRSQRPQERTVISDDFLRELGLWLSGKKNDDAREAEKHLIVLARKLEKEYAEEHAD